MKVLLIDADSKMPNLALMKLSAFHKKQGDEVYLRRGLSPELSLDFSEPDIAYVSCIFEKNRQKALNLAERFRKIGINVASGGPAIGNELPEHIERIMPDYSLYGVDYSMGFTSRGCIRQCPFCNVWRYEGGIRDNAPITEFHNPKHGAIMLLDNNILASPKFHENWSYVLKHYLKVCVTQGFDARLITEEFAELIAEAHCYDLKFVHRAVYTAWDNPRDREPVLTGIMRLLTAGVHPHSIIVYMLVSYNTSLEEDLSRFKALRELHVMPFLMPYNCNRNHPMLRYGQRPSIYTRMSFEKYNELKLAGYAHPEEAIHRHQVIASMR